MKRNVLFLILIASAILFGEEWVARYNGPADSGDYARAIAVDSQGNVYVTGASYGQGTDYDYATIKYSPDGEELWVRRYNGPGNGRDDARAIAVDNQGNVYVTGKSFGGATDYDCVTIKYSPDGEELWVRRYDGRYIGRMINTNDLAYAIAVDNQGNVYVTGAAHDTFNLRPRRAVFDYATIKYGPNGETLWVRRYNGPFRHDDAQAIAVHNDNVYVTGWSEGLNTSYDYATIKYSSVGIKEEKVREKILFTPYKAKEVYDITGKRIKDLRRIKKGIYFFKDKYFKKVIILN